MQFFDVADTVCSLYIYVFGLFCDVHSIYVTPTKSNDSAIIHFIVFQSNNQLTPALTTRNSFRFQDIYKQKTLPLYQLSYMYNLTALCAAIPQITLDLCSIFSFALSLSTALYLWLPAGSLIFLHPYVITVQSRSEVMQTILTSTV